MKNKRIYLFPVISFSLIAAFKIIFIFVAFNAIHESGDREFAAVLRRKLIVFETFFWPALLICEIIIYTRIRKRIYKRVWVILHTWCSIIAFFIWPFLAVFINYLLADYYSPKEYKEILNHFNLVRLTFFYLLIAIGHVFFILTIVKRFNNDQTAITNETPGVLDEFVS